MIHEKKFMPQSGIAALPDGLLVTLDDKYSVDQRRSDC